MSVLAHVCIGLLEVACHRQCYRNCRYYITLQFRYSKENSWHFRQLYDMTRDDLNIGYNYNCG